MTPAGMGGLLSTGMGGSFELESVTGLTGIRTTKVIYPWRGKTSSNIASMNKYFVTSHESKTQTQVVVQFSRQAFELACIASRSNRMGRPTSDLYERAIMLMNQYSDEDLKKLFKAFRI